MLKVILATLWLHNVNTLQSQRPPTRGQSGKYYSKFYVAVLVRAWEVQCMDILKTFNAKFSFYIYL